MALFDQNDFTGRLLRLFPTGWLPDVAPRQTAILQAPAMALSMVYAMLSFVKAQQRVSTASGSFLDLAAADYFGDNLPRLQYEMDPAYAARIEYNLTAPRGTRDGMAKMLDQLTGNAPIIFQPNRAADCICMASLDTPGIAGSGGPLASAAGGGFQAPYPCYGYQEAGKPAVAAWGSLLMPCQVFIIVAPPVTGFAIYTGYDGLGSKSSPNAGGDGGMASLSAPYATGSGIPMLNPDALPGEVTDASIYQQVDEWMPVGYAAWVLVSNQEIY
jgi:hypothetical protein